MRYIIIANWGGNCEIVSAGKSQRCRRQNIGSVIRCQLVSTMSKIHSNAGEHLRGAEEQYHCV